MADTLTIGEIVRSDEFELVLSVIRAEANKYRREILTLDPDDPALPSRTMKIAAKIQALRSLCRKFYEEADMEPVLADAVFELLP